jgi:hypothetical protein
VENKTACSIFRDDGSGSINPVLLGGRQRVHSDQQPTFQVEASVREWEALESVKEQQPHGLPTVLETNQGRPSGRHEKELNRKILVRLVLLYKSDSSVYM